MKGRVLVRCLGPGEEHEFLSHDRVRNRVCPRCRVTIKEMSTRCSQVMQEPNATVEHVAREWVRSQKDK